MDASIESIIDARARRRLKQLASPTFYGGKCGGQISSVVAGGVVLTYVSVFLRMLGLIP